MCGSLHIVVIAAIQAKTNTLTVLATTEVFI